MALTFVKFSPLKSKFSLLISKFKKYHLISTFVDTIWILLHLIKLLFLCSSHIILLIRVKSPLNLAIPSLMLMAEILIQIYGVGKVSCLLKEARKMYQSAMDNLRVEFSQKLTPITM